MKTKLITTVITALTVLNIASCGSTGGAFADSAQDKKQVLTAESELGSEKVQYKEYRYFFMNNKNDLYGADALMDAEMTAKVKALTEDNIRTFHAVNLVSKKHGAELTKDEKKAVDSYTESYRKEGGLDEDSYKVLLNQHFTTDSFFKSLYENRMLSDKLFEKLIEDGTVPTNGKIIDEVFGSDEILCLKEIFIKHNGGETVPIAKARAEEVFEKLKGGADFEELMTEYSNYNPEQLPPEHGYYTAEYDAIEPVWEAANDLVEGEYSTVIESAYGFHIVMRCEKDEEYMTKKRDDIVLMYQRSEYTRYLEGIADGITLSYTDYGAGLNLSAME